MKKTLLALAAVAASSAAFAQSSVTLYGVLDASVESVKDGNTAHSGQTVTRLSSDNLSTSKIGFKGVEDLGDGMNAKFNLESQLAVDTGAQADSSRFFNRQAWASVGGSFGDIRLGRTDSAIADVASNALGSAQNYDELKVVGTRAAKVYRFIDNSVSYFLPSFVPGLSAELQYSTAAIGNNATTGVPVSSNSTTGSEVAGSNAGKLFGLNVKYVNGPVFAGVGYLNAKDENSVVANNQKGNATLVYGGYDFAVVKLTAFYDAETALPTTAAANIGKPRLTVAGLKVAVPVATNFNIITSLSRARNVAGSTASNDNATLLSVRAVYDLSKRTSVYAMLSNVKNGNGASVAATANASLVGTAQTGATNHAIAAGLRVTF